MLTLFIDNEQKLSNAEYISRPKENLLVKLLFKPDVLFGPATLYRILRHYLVLKGFTCIPLSGSTRIFKGLANFFFNGEEDKKMHLKLLKTCMFRINIEMIHQMDAKNRLSRMIIMTVEES